MRIVLDMQGAQAANARRGIGRYGLSFALEFVRRRGGHEVHLLLNDAFPATAESIRAAFAGYLPAADIHAWAPAGAVNHIDHANESRRLAAETTREAFIAALAPDALVVTSLFEDGDAVTSIGTLPARHLTAVILYDLIPLVHRGIYLTNPDVARGYMDKIDHLRRADLLLAISAASGREASEHLGVSPQAIVNISAACGAHFRAAAESPERADFLARRYGLARGFVLYTGGIDHRKNIEGLIRAFAKLSDQTKAAYQLAIVCGIEPADRVRLLALAREQGLGPDEMIITGYVPEDDLVAIYQQCSLFVFASWHEGFGLPALEAMACGRPVIAANTSSLPDVIGRPDALFDPHDDAAITAKMQAVLDDEGLRAALAAHGLAQAEKFSWARTADAAWDALGLRVSQVSAVAPPAARRRLAYISPLPPLQTGVGTYSAELLPHLSKYYEIDIISTRHDIADEWTAAHCKIRDIAWFRNNAGSFERIIYQFGNSEFHAHMFELLEDFPGVIVLHDFFLSGIIAHREFNGEAPEGWNKALLRDHGWHALAARQQAQARLAEIIWAYPCSLGVIQAARGVIVHSQFSRQLARQWYGGQVPESWAVIAHLRAAAAIDPWSMTRAAIRESLGFGADDIVVCSFGHLGATKLNHRLLAAWQASPLARDPHCHLIFVGKNAQDEYGRKLLSQVAASRTAGRVEILDWMDQEVFRLWLTAADIGVQLRSFSRGETSGTIYDCLGHGIATIVNANGANAELSRDAVWMLPDEFSDAELGAALQGLRHDTGRRATLGAQGRLMLESRHQPADCAAGYFQAIEGFYRQNPIMLPDATNAILQTAPELTEADRIHIAAGLARDFPPHPRRRQLLLDISELVQRDARSGIQRVVRAILRAYLSAPPAEFAILPVYATKETRGYRHASRFIRQFLELPDDNAPDEWVDAWPGDLFLGLDLQPEIVPAQEEFLSAWHRRGVRVMFVVYDLLPVLLPELFIEGALPLYRRWLATLSRFDGVICISRAVADEFGALPQDFLPGAGPNFIRRHFHLGADIDVTTKNPLSIKDGTARQMAKNPSFLMVGTIEARKGHGQALAAFERLWAEGVDINLVIIGKPGWKVEALINTLGQHAERGRRLFWLQGIADDLLETIYAAATCLLLPSLAEGFGLPMIEAARHKIPIIARDIPVFREVAGPHAFYFTGTTPMDLAAALRTWLALHAENQAPSSAAMPWLTWQESAARLMTLIREDGFQVPGV